MLCYVAAVSFNLNRDSSSGDFDLHCTVFCSARKHSDEKNVLLTMIVIDIAIYKACIRPSILCIPVM